MSALFFAFSLSPKRFSATRGAVAPHFGHVLRLTFSLDIFPRLSKAFSVASLLPTRNLAPNNSLGFSVFAFLREYLAVEGAIVNGFLDVVGLDSIATLQVGDRPRHAQQGVSPAAREGELFARLFDALLRGVGDFAHLAQRLAPQSCVELWPAPDLPLPHLDCVVQTMIPSCVRRKSIEHASSTNGWA